MDEGNVMFRPTDTIKSYFKSALQRARESRPSDFILVMLASMYRKTGRALRSILVGKVLESAARGPGSVN
jgi:hypothetical protein